MNHDPIFPPHRYRETVISTARNDFFSSLTKTTHVFPLLSRYILSIEKAEEIEEYVGDLLQGTDGKKGLFINELLVRWKKTQRKSADNANNLFVMTEAVPSAGNDINPMPFNAL